METLGDKIQLKISQNSAFKYYCKYCDYGTCKKSNYESHILSAKHSKVTNDYNMGQNSAEIQPTFSQHSTKEKFVCSCGKEYHHRQGLWRHKKKCVAISDSKTDYDSEYDSDNEKGPSDKELIMMLIKENSEFKNMMIKVLENGTHNTTNNINSHNKSFNLHFFLNETCKNAMNINDFVDSLQLQISDLENVGEVGYIEGISSIIIKKLNTLDVTERPIHCTDKKRETMYIKDEDKWEKEDEKHLKMHKLVRKVANKNINLISEFQKLHPEWKKCSSKYADQHNKIVIESMGGKGDNDYEKEEKIIKKIAKEVFVDK
jgi:Txe/YoeB family toxin of Txe-Axe toxin-antitoxin module